MDVPAWTLIPFVLMLLVFIADPRWAKASGAALVLLILVRTVRQATTTAPIVVSRGDRRDAWEAPTQD